MGPFPVQLNGGGSRSIFAAVPFAIPSGSQGFFQYFGLDPGSANGLFVASNGLAALVAP